MEINNSHMEIVKNNRNIIDRSRIIGEGQGPSRVDKFQNVLFDNLSKVNNLQKEADRLTNGFITGEVDNLHEVMLATEEARLSLELAVQVRNKFVEAFKEVSNMQL